MRVHSLAGVCLRALVEASPAIPVPTPTLGSQGMDGEGNPKALTSRFGTAIILPTTTSLAHRDERTTG